MISLFKSAAIVIFSLWISFVPEPVQQRSLGGVVVFLCLALFVLARDGRSWRKNMFSFSDWPLWLFLCAVAFGMINAADKIIALKSYLYLSVLFFLVYYFGKTLAGSRELLLKFITALSLCGIAVSVFGILEVIFRYNPLYVHFINNPYYVKNISGVIARPMATLFNPIPLATYLVCMLPLGIFLSKDAHAVRGCIGYCAVILNSICLGLIFSRASVLGLALMGFCYLFLKRRYRASLLLIVVLLVVLNITSFLPYPFSRLSVKGIGSYAGGILDGGRIIRMQMSWAMFKAHPFFGVGLNHFRELFDRFYPFKSQLRFLLYEVKVPENMYCSLLAETGAAGVAGFLVLAVSLLSRASRKMAKITDQSGRRILLLFISLFAGIMVSMAGYELFYWFTPYVLFCLTCGFLSAAEYS